MRVILNEANRKPLVTLLGQYTGEKPLYLKAPTYAYQIGVFTVTRDGNIEGPEMNQEEFEDLIDFLDASGYRPEEVEREERLEEKEVSDAQVTEPGVTISIPLENVLVGNLTKILDAKGALIKKALGVEDIRIEVDPEKVSFPWFEEISSEKLMTYTKFIAAICKMSKEQKRINTTDKEVVNEKYAFRCFLLRLGFIGDEYKQDRKILLQNLSGSSAFRDGAKKEVPGDEISK